jgi:hypothetical protein
MINSSTLLTKSEGSDYKPRKKGAKKARSTPEKERKEQWKDMVKETAKKYERADNLSKMRSHEKRNRLLFFLITLLQNKIFTFTKGGRTGHSPN